MMDPRKRTRNSATYSIGTPSCKGAFAASSMLAANAQQVMRKRGTAEISLVIALLSVEIKEGVDFNVFLSPNPPRPHRVLLLGNRLRIPRKKSLSCKNRRGFPPSAGMLFAHRGP